MISETDENYLKEAYALQQEHDSVTTSMLSARLGHSPATVTGMLKKLASRQWVSYQPYRGITLTESGRAIALEVIRHHRLIEAFLVKVLNIPWDKVHNEAEQLEHVLSDYLEDRIDDLLGHPIVDPHGSPIPSKAGVIEESPKVFLKDLPKGARAEVLEVSDRDPELLARLDRLGLYPKTKLTVLDVEPIDGLFTIQVSNATHVLGLSTTGRIRVKKLPSEGGKIE